MMLSRWVAALVCGQCLLSAYGSAPLYKLMPLPSFGAEVRDVNVAALVGSIANGDANAVAAGEWLSKTLHQERILVFRDQGSIPWKKQVAFTKLFGTGEMFNETQHTNREPHPANPDHFVATFSNDIRYGATGVGTEGWHVDGNVVSNFISLSFPGPVSYSYPLSRCRYHMP
jgi:alpha-ketoglutarate-dependent taurine dioxygenase